MCNYGNRLWSDLWPGVERQYVFYAFSYKFWKGDARRKDQVMWSGHVTIVVTDISMFDTPLNWSVAPEHHQTYQTVPAHKQKHLATPKTPFLWTHPPRLSWPWRNQSASCCWTLPGASAGLWRLRNETACGYQRCRGWREQELHPLPGAENQDSNHLWSDWNVEWKLYIIVHIMHNYHN